MALKTVEETWNMWANILFVDATTRETATGALELYAKTLNVGKTHQDMLQWLAGRRDSWLMVIDNVDDISVRINDFFPSGNRGSILITTRIPGLAMLARGSGADVSVASMVTSDGLQLLLKTSGMEELEISGEEQEATMQLLESFGYLALAIVQAGAYIRCSKCTISQYRDMFVNQRQATLERYADLLVKVDDYEKSVYTTWHMSYKLLNTKAKKLLYLMAFMHHDTITEDIFRRAAIKSQTYYPVVPPTKDDAEALGYVVGILQAYLDSTGVWNSGAFLATMTEIISYSLISYNRKNRAYTLHVLVHDWASTVISHPEDVAVNHAAQLLALSIDYGHTMEHLTYLRMVEVHVNRVLERQPKPSANVAALFAEVYYRAGKWKQQEILEEIGLYNRRQALGEEHDHTLTSMSHIAHIYQKQGRYEEAARLQVQVLEARKQSLGEDSCTTLMLMSNLAVTFSHLKQHEMAEKMQVQVVDTSLRLYGADDNPTLLSMHNLASTYFLQGRCEQAEALLLQRIDARKRVSGEENPHTLNAMSILASRYRQQGRYDQAEALQIHVLEVQTRRLGSQHPETLSTMNDLGSLYCDQNRYEEAEPLYTQVLDTNMRLHGEDHSHTLAIMSHLARIYQEQYRYEEAEKLYVCCIAGYKRVLGAKDPHTLVTIKELLETYQDMGAKRQDEYEMLHAEFRALIGPQSDLFFLLSLLRQGKPPKLIWPNLL